MPFNVGIIGGRCVTECPHAMYANGDLECKACISGCQECSNGKPGECILCEPKKFNFHGVCLDLCPDVDLLNNGQMFMSDMIYQNNYTNYKCDKVVPSKNEILPTLEVKFA
jgi:hypothetical protein